MYRTLLLPSVIVVGFLTGCAQNDAAPITYDSPAQLNELGADFSAAAASQADGYRLLVSENTAGRFACDVAIAKFARPRDSSAPKVTLVPHTSAEQAYWTQRFRGVPQIRALTFITPKTVRLDGDGAESLCAAAASLGAPLLIAYSRSVTGPNAASAAGVVYRTSDAAVLATIYAKEDGPAMLAGDDKSLDKTNGDHRDKDARFKTQRLFEDHAFACIRALIHTDNAAPTTQPHDWQQPFVERWWMRARR